MRRLNDTQTDDRGVATIFVVLAMTAILVGAAFAIDVGGYVSTARSAQSSADGTVLALAADCARGGEPDGLYLDYYDEGNQTISPDPLISPSPPTCGPGNQATIIVTDEVDGLLLAQSAGDVSRRAVAEWGILSGATTAPVVISECTYEIAAAGGLPSEPFTIPLGSGGSTGNDGDNGGGSTGNGSGSTEPCGDRPPGAFGWLDIDSEEPCSATTKLDDEGQLIVKGKPGNGNEAAGYYWSCITSVGVGGMLTIPIYSAACLYMTPCETNDNDAVGNNIYYLLIGYAVIEVLGWDLQHGSPRSDGDVPICPPPASCIRGHFVDFVTQLGVIGNGSNFGVTKISLIE